MKTRLHTAALLLAGLLLPAPGVATASPALPRLGDRETAFIAFFGTPDSNSKPGVLDAWHPCANNQGDETSARFQHGQATIMVLNGCGDIGAIGLGAAQLFMPADARAIGTTTHPMLGRLYLYSSTSLAHSFPGTYRVQANRIDCEHDPVPAGTFFLAQHGFTLLRLGGCLP